jgi:hypothetical protein
MKPLYAILRRLVPQAVSNIGTFFHLAKMEIEKITLLRGAKGFIFHLIWYFFDINGVDEPRFFRLPSRAKESIFCSFGLRNSVHRRHLGAAVFIMMPIFMGVVNFVGSVINLILDKIFSSVDRIENQDNSRSLRIICPVVLSIILLFFGIVFVFVSSNYQPTGGPFTVFALMSIVQGFLVAVSSSSPIAALSACFGRPSSPKSMKRMMSTAMPCCRR